MRYTDDDRPDTRALVREAAYAMLMAGDKPSGPAIRARIGQGNNNTINAALKDFWLEVGDVLRGATVRPAGIPEEVYGLARSLWAQALPYAEQVFEAERVTLDARVTQAEERAVAAVRLQEEAARQVTALTAELATTQTTLRQLEQTLAAETARREQLEAHRAQVQQDAQAAVAQAETAVKTAEATLVRERERADREQARLLQQVDETRRQMEESKRQAAAQAGEAKAARAKVEARIEELTQLNQERIGALMQAQATIKSVEKERDTRAQEAEHLTRKLEQSQRAAEQAGREHAAALERRAQQIEDVRQELAKAREEAIVLRVERDGFKGELSRRQAELEAAQQSLRRRGVGVGTEGV